MKNHAKLAASIIAIVLLLYFVGFEKIAASLAGFQASLAVPVMALFIITVFLGAANLKILLDAKCRMNFSEYFREYFYSWAVGSILPGRVGDFSLAFLIREKIPAAESSAIILLDKLITLVVLSLAACLSMALFFGANSGLQAAGILIVCWIIGIIALFSEPGNKLISRIIPKRLEGQYRSFHSTTAHFLAKEKTRMAANLVVSIIKIWVQSYAFIIILSGLGVAARAEHIFLITSASTIISFVPITAGGVGIKEGAFAYMALQIGIPPEKSIATAAISAGLNYILVAAGAMAFMAKKAK